MAINLTRKVVLMFIVSITGVSAVACTRFRTLNDDENPIRVKNKILLFETEGKNSKWEPDRDSSAANKWRVKGNKHAGDQYEVNAYGSTNCLTPIRGETVDIVFDIHNSSGQVVETKKFTFKLEDVQNGKEPSLQAEEPMSADNGPFLKKLKFARTQDPGGAIREVTVHAGTSTTTCKFVEDVRVRVLVELCRGGC